MQQQVQTAETYPWSVQPRIVDGCTMWVAWSAEDGFTSSAYHEYDDAEAAMHNFIRAAEAEKRLQDSRTKTRARVMAAEKRSRVPVEIDGAAAV